MGVAPLADPSGVGADLNTIGSGGLSCVSCVVHRPPGLLWFGLPSDAAGPNQRIEALELFGTTLAHLNRAEAGEEVSSSVPTLIAIRDKVAVALREEADELCRPRQSGDTGSDVVSEAGRSWADA